MKTGAKGSAQHANTGDRIFEPGSLKAFGSVCLLLVLVGFLIAVSYTEVFAQDPALETFTLWGDIKIDDSKADTPAPANLAVILYDRRGTTVGRQNVSGHGRYRFTNLPAGEYEIAFEADDNEITRVHIAIAGTPNSDFRQDFEFEWKSKNGTPKSAIGVISAADVYDRNPANKSLFKKAEEAVAKKKYEQASKLLDQILSVDQKDFQVWTLLGTIYLVEEKLAEAEKAYLKALEVKPAFALALFNLGRLRTMQKRFDESIEPLTRAVEAQPQSADINLMLGEAYLQIKKGSKAIPYLNEAAKLGRPEAHLRLAWLYNAAGLKDRAAVEYEEFLKKKPDYPERKKLQEYIRANKRR